MDQDGFSIYRDGASYYGDFSEYSGPQNNEEAFNEEHHFDQLSEVMVSNFGVTSIKSDNSPIPAKNFRPLFESLSKKLGSFALSALKSNVDGIPTENYLKIRADGKDASVFMQEIYGRVLSFALKLPERDGEYTPSAMKSILKSKIRETLNKSLASTPIHSKIGISFGSEVTRQHVLVACGVCEMKKREEKAKRQEETYEETEFDEWRPMPSSSIGNNSSVPFSLQERSAFASEEERKLLSSLGDMTIDSKKIVMGSEDLSPFKDMFPSRVSSEAPLLFERGTASERIVSETPREVSLSASTASLEASFDQMNLEKGMISKLKDKLKRDKSGKKHSHKEEDEEEEKKRRKRRTYKASTQDPLLQHISSSPRAISSNRTVRDIETRGKHIESLGENTGRLFASLADSKKSTLFEGVSVTDVTVPLNCHDEGGSHHHRDPSMPPLVNISSPAPETARMQANNSAELGPNQELFIAKLRDLFASGFQSGATDVFLPSEGALQWLVDLGKDKVDPLNYRLFWSCHLGTFDKSTSNVFFRNNAKGSVVELSDKSGFIINHEHAVSPRKVSSKIPMKIGDRQVDVWIHDSCMPNGSKKQ